ncbi:hypothetical protein PSENEW3_00000516 [Picochlorum sp. SENEW3]|nr:hypothetical protein PSENEW3_00000516 [Picochlorum sp. SENEW3]
MSTSDSDVEELSRPEGERLGGVRGEQKSPSSTEPQDGGHRGSVGMAPIMVGAGIVGVLVGVGARFLLKSRRSKEKSAVESSSGRVKNRSRQGGVRKVPPRRPRSVASSDVDSSSVKSPVSPVEGTKKSGSGVPALPPRRAKKHALKTTPEAAPEEEEKMVVAKESKPEEPVVEEKKEDHESEESKKLKGSATAALAATAAAAAAGDAMGTLHSAEDVSDIVDDQIELMKKEAIESVVEIVDAEVAAEEAAQDAEKVIEESKQAAAMEEVSAALGSHDSKKNKTEEDEEEKSATTDVKEPVTEAEAPEAPEAPEAQQEEVVDVMATTFTLEDLRGKTLSGKAKGEDKTPPVAADEEESQYEHLDDIPHPTLSFAEAPKDTEEELTPLEKKIRDMCIHAHKLIKENNKIKQGLKEQQAAMDLCLGPEGYGKVRATLVAACAFSLSDMLVAERQINETKVALAVALDAIRQADSKGGAVRAYMNYAYVLRNISKHKSTRDTYISAYEQAKKDFTLVSQNTEQVKYEYTAYLAKAGRTRECVDFLLKAAEELQAEANVLEAKGDTAEEEKKEEEKKEEEGSDLPGLTPTQTEDEDANTKKLTPPQLARHFAMRNLLNAAGVLDTMGEHEEAQEVLANALELAIKVHGENSIQHMNALYAVGVHCKTRGALEEAIQAHEAVLNIMDSTISVYEPDLLQNRIAILRDTAILYDQQGHPEIAIDYAEGACVNAQTLSKIFAQSGVGAAQRANMMEQFWLLLSELKNKVGDTEGAAAARREALKGKLNLGMAARGGRTGGASAGRATHKRTGASTRAGGRRV